MTTHQHFMFRLSEGNTVADEGLESFAEMQAKGNLRSG